MGSCLSIRRRNNPDHRNSFDNANAPNAGLRKNHPLCHEIIRWKSDVPLTEGQLRSKRDEFWDTAPAFEGRKEIWDALHAAASAAESNDFQLAQAILDGANISVPNGFLTESYDELGNKYMVPVYCLSYPINITKETSGRDSPMEVFDLEEGAGGQEISIKLRLSNTCQDVKMKVYTQETVAMIKKRLQSQEGIDPSKQRWYYGGKLLSDRLRMSDISNLGSGFVIQVIINPLPSPPVQSLPRVESNKG
ncbi:hypothetical protein WDU94_012545, partial [Cyamophila willieti]